MRTKAVEIAKKTAVQSFWNGFNDYSDPFAGAVHQRTSTQKKDTLPRLGAAPFPQEWEGDRNYKRAIELSYDIENKPYEVSLRIDKEFIKYQQWDEIANLSRNAGMKARAHRIKLHSTDLINGFSTAGDDGQNFFHTAHADPGAEYTTAQDNDLTTTWADADNPTDLEFAAAIRLMMDKLFQFYDDRGDPYAVPGESPENFVLLIPSKYRSIAKRVQNAEQLTGSVGNDLKGEFVIRVNQFLTAPSTTGVMYLLYTGSSHKPLIEQRVAPLRIETREERKNGDLLIEGDWWGRTAYGQWRVAIAHTATE